MSRFSLTPTSNTDNLDYFDLAIDKDNYDFIYKNLDIIFCKKLRKHYRKFIVVNMTFPVSLFISFHFVYWQLV